jgi:4-hydroxy-tetrahydrodipicolinate reductase
VPRAGQYSHGRTSAARAGSCRQRRQRFAEPGSAGRERRAARGVRVALFGAGGKVGSVLGPALEAAGHELVDLNDAEAMVDFTSPEVVVDNITRALDVGVPCVVGTSGWGTDEVAVKAVEAGLPVFYAPNFALGAVLMMRFAAEAVKHLPRAEIVELHHEAKLDAPSGTAKATAEAMGGDVPIHSVRLPGIVAHQEVLLSEPGELLTIRHDAFSREAYIPGVLLALERLPSLPPGLTLGLDRLLEGG